MKTQQIVKELELAAQQLGLRVRYDKGSFRGGLCVVEDEPIVMLNRRHPAEIHLSILAECLRSQPADTIFLKPAVRHALEEAWNRRARAEDSVEGDTSVEPSAAE